MTAGRLRKQRKSDPASNPKKKMGDSRDPGIGQRRSDPQKKQAEKNPAQLTGLTEGRGIKVTTEESCSGPGVTALWIDGAGYSKFKLGGGGKKIPLLRVKLKKSVPQYRTSPEKS